MVERGATEFRRLESAVFKSLVQFLTGPVAAVKGAKTTGNRSPSAFKAVGPPWRVVSTRAPTLQGQASGA